VGGDGWGGKEGGREEGEGRGLSKGEQKKKKNTNAGRVSRNVSFWGMCVAGGKIGNVATEKTALRNSAVPSPFGGMSSHGHAL